MESTEKKLPKVKKKKAPCSTGKTTAYYETKCHPVIEEKQGEKVSEEQHSLQNTTRKEETGSKIFKSSQLKPKLIQKKKVEDYISKSIIQSEEFKESFDEIEHKEKETSMNKGKNKEKISTSKTILNQRDDTIIKESSVRCTPFLSDTKLIDYQHISSKTIKDDAKTEDNFLIACKNKQLKKICKIVPDKKNMISNVLSPEPETETEKESHDKKETYTNVFAKNLNKPQEEIKKVKKNLETTKKLLELKEKLRPTDHITNNLVFSNKQTIYETTDIPNLSKIPKKVSRKTKLEMQTCHPEFTIEELTLNEKTKHVQLKQFKKNPEKQQKTVLEKDNFQKISSKVPIKHEKKDVENNSLIKCAKDISSANKKISKEALKVENIKKKSKCEDSLISGSVNIHQAEIQQPNPTSLNRRSKTALCLQSDEKLPAKQDLKFDQNLDAKCTKEGIKSLIEKELNTMDTEENNPKYKKVKTLDCINKIKEVVADQKTHSKVTKKDEKCFDNENTKSYPYENKQIRKTSLLCKRNDIVNEKEVLKDKNEEKINKNGNNEKTRHIIAQRDKNSKTKGKKTEKYSDPKNEEKNKNKYAKKENSIDVGGKRETVKTKTEVIENNQKEDEKETEEEKESQKDMVIKKIEKAKKKKESNDKVIKKIGKEKEKKESKDKVVKKIRKSEKKKETEAKDTEKYKDTKKLEDESETEENSEETDINNEAEEETDEDKQKTDNEKRETNEDERKREEEEREVDKEDRERKENNSTEEETEIKEEEKETYEIEQETKEDRKETEKKVQDIEKNEDSEEMNLEKMETEEEEAEINEIEEATEDEYETEEGKAEKNEIGEDTEVEYETEKEDTEGKETEEEETKRNEIEEEAEEEFGTEDDEGDKNEIEEDEDEEYETDKEKAEMKETGEDEGEKNDIEDDTNEEYETDKEEAEVKETEEEETQRSEIDKETVEDYETKEDEEEEYETYKEEAEVKETEEEETQRIEIDEETEEDYETKEDEEEEYETEEDADEEYETEEDAEEEYETDKKETEVKETEEEETERNEIEEKAEEEYETEEDIGEENDIKEEVDGETDKKEIEKKEKEKVKIEKKEIKLEAEEKYDSEEDEGDDNDIEDEVTDANEREDEAKKKYETEEDEGEENDIEDEVTDANEREDEAKEKYETEEDEGEENDTEEEVEEEYETDYEEIEANEIEDTEEECETKEDEREENDIEEDEEEKFVTEEDDEEKSELQEVEAEEKETEEESETDEVEEVTEDEKEMKKNQKDSEEDEQETEYEDEEGKEYKETDKDEKVDIETEEEEDTDTDVNEKVDTETEEKGEEDKETKEEKVSVDRNTEDNKSENIETGEVEEERTDTKTATETEEEKDGTNNNDFRENIILEEMANTLKSKQRLRVKDKRRDLDAKTADERCKELKEESKEQSENKNDQVSEEKYYEDSEEEFDVKINEKEENYNQDNENEYSGEKSNGKANLIIDKTHFDIVNADQKKEIRSQKNEDQNEEENVNCCGKQECPEIEIPDNKIAAKNIIGNLEPHIDTVMDNKAPRDSFNKKQETKIESCYEFQKNVNNDKYNTYAHEKVVPANDTKETKTREQRDVKINAELDKKNQEENTNDFDHSTYDTHTKVIENSYIREELSSKKYDSLKYLDKTVEKDNMLLKSGCNYSNNSISSKFSTEDIKKSTSKSKKNMKTKMGNSGFSLKGEHSSFVVSPDKIKKYEINETIEKTSDSNVSDQNKKENIFHDSGLFQNHLTQEAKHLSSTDENHEENKHSSDNADDTNASSNGKDVETFEIPKMEQFYENKNNNKTSKNLDLFQISSSNDNQKDFPEKYISVQTISSNLNNTSDKKCTLMVSNINKSICSSNSDISKRVEEINACLQDHCEPELQWDDIENILCSNTDENNYLIKTKQESSSSIQRNDNLFELDEITEQVSTFQRQNIKFISQQEAYKFDQVPQINSSSEFSTLSSEVLDYKEKLSENSNSFKCHPDTYYEDNETDGLLKDFNIELEKCNYSEVIRENDEPIEDCQVQNSSESEKLHYITVGKAIQNNKEIVLNKVYLDTVADFEKEKEKNLCTDMKMHTNGISTLIESPTSPNYLNSNEMAAIVSDIKDSVVNFTSDKIKSENAEKKLLKKENLSTSLLLNKQDTSPTMPACTLPLLSSSQKNIHSQINQDNCDIINLNKNSKITENLELLIKSEDNCFMQTKYKTEKISKLENESEKNNSKIHKYFDGDSYANKNKSDLQEIEGSVEKKDPNFSFLNFQDNSQTASILGKIMNVTTKMVGSDNENRKNINHKQEENVTTLKSEGSNHHTTEISTNRNDQTIERIEEPNESFLELTNSEPFKVMLEQDESNIRKHQSLNDLSLENSKAVIINENSSSCQPIAREFSASCNELDDLVEKVRDKNSDNVENFSSNEISNEISLQELPIKKKSKVTQNNHICDEKINPQFNSTCLETLTEISKTMINIMKLLEEEHTKKNLVLQKFMNLDDKSQNSKSVNTKILKDSLESMIEPAETLTIPCERLIEYQLNASDETLIVPPNNDESETDLKTNNKQIKLDNSDKKFYHISDGIDKTRLIKNNSEQEIICNILLKTIDDLPISDDVKRDNSDEEVSCYDVFDGKNLQVGKDLYNSNNMVLENLQEKFENRLSKLSPIKTQKRTFNPKVIDNKKPYENTSTGFSGPSLGINVKEIVMSIENKAKANEALNSNEVSEILRLGKEKVESFLGCVDEPFNDKKDQIEQSFKHDESKLTCDRYDLCNKMDKSVEQDPCVIFSKNEESDQTFNVERNIISTCSNTEFFYFTNNSSVSETDHDTLSIKSDIESVKSLEDKNSLAEELIPNQHNDFPLVRSLSETNLKKEVKFSVSNDDLESDHLLSISVEGDKINVITSSRTLASSTIDISSSETGFKFKLCSTKSKSQTNIFKPRNYTTLNHFSTTECINYKVEDLNSTDILENEDTKTKSYEKYENEHTVNKLDKNSNDMCKGIQDLTVDYLSTPLDKNIFKEYQSEPFQIIIEDKSIENRDDNESNKIIIGDESNEGTEINNSIICNETHTDSLTNNVREDLSLFSKLIDSEHYSDQDNEEILDDSFSIDTVIENVHYRDQTFSENISGPWEENANYAEMDLEENISNSTSQQISDKEEPFEIDNIDELSYYSPSSSTEHSPKSLRNDKIIFPKKRTISMQNQPIIIQQRIPFRPYKAFGRNTKEHLCKILVIGSSSTGKTSIIRRYVKQTFSPSYRATIGADFLTKTISWDENLILHIQFWDIAGQDRFSLLSRSFYRDAVGAFIVSDLTRSETLESVKRWKEELDLKIENTLGGRIPCFLLANKCDLLENTHLSSKQQSKVCQQFGFQGWIQTSAKEDVNINEAVNMLLKVVVENLVDDTEDCPPPDDDSIRLDLTDKKKKQSCKC